MEIFLIIVCIILGLVVLYFLGLGLLYVKDFFIDIIVGTYESPKKRKAREKLELQRAQKINENEQKRRTALIEEQRKDKEYLDRLPKAQREKVLAERLAKEDEERRRRIDIMQEKALKEQEAQRLKEMYSTKTNVARCPVCNSGNIKKITLTNKAASITLFGLYSAGHVSKTYKCHNCGAKF